MAGTEEPPKTRRGRWIGLGAGLVVLAAGVGAAAGYALWSERNWYAARDPSSLPAGTENDLIRYGWELVIDTPRHIGKAAADPAMRFADNDLACTNCHLDAGLKPFAAPLVSTYASYPLMVDDKVVTLADRINGCMERSMNGKAMPGDSREMNAFIAYIRWLGEGTPTGVRVAGMGLLPLRPAAEKPDPERGKAAFAQNCARCHGADGQGQMNAPPKVGWSFPPLWGDGSFNDAAGMSHIETAAAFIHANMPRGVVYEQPMLADQQAWDIAAFVTTQPRPRGPAR